MAPGDLQEVLAVLRPGGRPLPPDLLVGLGAADDAAGSPRERSKAISAEVFRGGSEKMAEAGGVVAGGHTVVDPEPKYGLCVTGRVHPDRILIKGGLRAGDAVFLSKPLGTGVITTAAKAGAAGADVIAGAVASMLRLNRVASEVARATGARGGTAIPG